MKIAVVTDIHANILAMEAVAQDLKDQKADVLVFLGDLVLDGTHPTEVFDLLESLDPFIWIKGNNDDLLIDADDSYFPNNDFEKIHMEKILWARERLGATRINSLMTHSITQNIEEAGHVLTFCHGSPDSNSFAIRPNQTFSELEKVLKNVSGEMLICGHTHRRFIISVGERTIANFGAVSIPGDDFSHDARYGIIELEEDRIALRPRDCVYDTERFLKEMAAFDYPDYKTIMGKFGYP